MAPNCTFMVQTWNGEQKVGDDIPGLSIDAAREIAIAHHSLMGYSTRIMAEPESVDYCEVYSKYGNRKGTFGETTLCIGGAV